METLLSYRLEDFLLFSADTYLRLFVRANTALWPWVVAAHLIGVVGAVLAMARTGPPVHAAILVVYGLAWLTSGWYFLLGLYAPVNWAVAEAHWLFTGQAFALFVIAIKAAFDRQVVNRDHVRFSRGPAVVILLIGIVASPLIPLIHGREITPLGAGSEYFAIAPDPTAILTLGILLYLRPAWFGLALVVPVLWLAFSALTLYALGLWSALIPASALAVGLAAALQRRAV